MADQAKGLPPSEAVRTNPFLPAPTNEVIHMLCNACESALVELHRLYLVGHHDLGNRHAPIRRRIMIAQAAAEALRFGDVKAVNMLLRFQADADACESEVGS